MFLGFECGKKSRNGTPKQNQHAADGTAGTGFKKKEPVIVDSKAKKKPDVETARMQPRSSDLLSVTARPVRKKNLEPANPKLRQRGAWPWPGHMARHTTRACKGPWLKARFLSLVWGGSRWGVITY